MAPKRTILSVLLLCLLQCDTTFASAQELSAPLPDIEVASRSPNAFRIFNAVHSALRQWGSSIQHNGLSFFPVTIPEGNLFYHGRHDAEKPASFEWLAFEMEHASQFAQSYDFPDDSVSPSLLSKGSQLGQALSLHGKVSSIEAQIHGTHDAGEERASDTSFGQYILTEHGSDDDDDHGKPPNRRPHYPPSARGYLQTYRAAQPLNLLYLDGMAAAKCPLGTLDSQNLILLDWDGRKDMMRDEWERAGALCRQAAEWGIDGYIRMEAGFEIIYCNFSTGAGLDLVSVHGSPWRNETHDSANEGWGGEWFVMGAFEWLRAASARYHGMVRGRADIDFSGMVSAFSYDVNTTNPDTQRPELPRIVNATAEERQGIRDRVREVLRARQGKTASSVDWQAVVDNIVTRFSARLWFLTEASPSARNFRSQLATLLYPFLDFPDDISLENVSRALERCTDIHLSTVALDQKHWTPEDHAIYAAVRSVSHTICDSLFTMRKEIHSTNGTTSGDDDAAERVQSLALDLRAKLDWTTWKECGKCPTPEEMCFVAMFPGGDAEDHFTPRCKNQDEIGYGYFFNRPLVS
ncbi:hypothetical protein CONLIGDRAFT_635453 [Coniochaeta ligniaria NRRL 30616]|uniref:Uncharacterized protein n=1 Tax=Coniochaeta ligniaria NRRL 30616 TaxID=1408157 RepID=A0A1J7JDF8_9PEZI|nr:hypothetical protein CONLIGDRAFT_635453 [Coniochaeta ligniaria NRRL 30616]